MNIRFIAYYLGLFIPLLTPTAESASIASLAKWGTLTFANNLQIDIEIADTQSLRASGLMHRNRLGHSQGMLFVYPEQAQQGVWMKNTLLALDIIFISSDGKITAILENLPPCLHDPCPIYNSIAAARYMLEVQAGFIVEHHIKIGQETIIEYRHENGQQ